VTHSEAEKRGFEWLALAYSKMYPVCEAIRDAADKGELIYMTMGDRTRIIAALVAFEEWERRNKE